VQPEQDWYITCIS